MSDVTVRQLAQVLGMPIDKLVEQFSEAGMKVSGPDQVVSSTDKVKLLGFLRRTHGKKDATPVSEASPKQITLKRKQVSEITVSAGAARGKTVNIEVRQKRTYVNRNELDEQEQPHSDEREHALKLLAESRFGRMPSWPGSGIWMTNSVLSKTASARKKKPVALPPRQNVVPRKPRVKRCDWQPSKPHVLPRRKKPA